MPGEQDSYRPRRGPRHLSLQVRGLGVHLTRWGDPGAHDPPVVLLHGWEDAGESFQLMVDAFADDRPLLAPDWRGFGRSDWAAAGYWFHDYLADLDALLDRFSPDGPVRLVGHSMGGHIASLYAGVRPARVRCLVNIEGLGVPRASSDGVPARLRRWLDEVKSAPPARDYASFGQLAASIRAHHPRLCDARADFLASAWGRLGADGRVRLKADPRHRWVNPVPYHREDAEACWRNIEAPMLILVGAESQYLRRLGTDGEEAALRRAFPRAEWIHVPDAGHLMHVECPERVASLIEPFLRVH